MALPTRDELRTYLRIETEVEDDLLDRLLAQAIASVEAYIRQPIEARAVTFTVYPTWSGGTVRTLRLLLPYAPIGDPVTVADDDGTALVAETDYTVQPATGRLLAVSSGAGFGTGPYTVTATVGLSLRDDYATAVEPAISAAIIDWAADLYQRRNPAASYESGGGGVAVNYNETASKTMPSRIRVTLDPWRRVLV